MKRILRISVSMLLVFSLLLTGLPVSADAPTSGKLGNSNITWSFNTTTGVLTVGGSGEMPSSGDSPDWLRHSSRIKSVVIKSGVAEIGGSAFYDCPLLTSISIPDTVTWIGERAFAYCPSLTDITLPKHLYGLGSQAFLNCTSLKGMELPASVRALGRYIFQGCSSFRQLKLNEGLEVIPEYAFYGIWLGALTIPRSVKTIESSAFEYAAFDQLVFQEGLESIQYRSFCSSRVNGPIILPESLRYVGNDAFLVAEFAYLVVKNKNCTLGSAVYPSLPSGTVIYGKPQSTAQKLVEDYPNYEYVFKPMYFNDVAPGAWYFDAVNYAKENSLFDGVGNGRFAPETTMTRAMMVQVLYNYAGDGEICENTFVDVPDSTWYTNAVAWAAQNGIVNGVGDGRFDPEGKLTREQLASIMFRFTNWQGEDTSKTDTLVGFADTAKVSPWAEASMRWAVGQGLINGVDQNGRRYLQPQSYASRAQVATILMRNIEQIKADKTVELSIFAEGTCCREIEAAAEAYMAVNELVKIDITMFDVAFFKDPQFNEYSQIRGEVDLVFSVGDETVPYLEQIKLAAPECTVPVAMTPYVFAVNYGDPDGVQSIERLIGLLKRKELTINLAAGNTALGKYSNQIFMELGVSEEMFESFAKDTSVNSEEAAAMVCLGYADSTIVRKTDAIEQGLVSLGSPEGHEAGDLLKATIMNKATQPEAAQQFIDFLVQYTEEGNLEQNGYNSLR